MIVWSAPITLSLFMIELDNILNSFNGLPSFLSIALAR